MKMAERVKIVKPDKARIEAPGEGTEWIEGGQVLSVSIHSFRGGVRKNTIRLREVKNP